MNTSLPMEEVREVLLRAVRSIAPEWLAPEVDDLVQSALLKLMKIERPEESKARSASYLWRTAHSAVMDELRRRRRRRETSLDDEDGAGQAIAPPDQSKSTPESGEVKTLIESGLNQLDKPRRLAVLLYLYGYTLKESAAKLGWSTKQVDNRRYRGLADLRSYLRERGYGP